MARSQRRVARDLLSSVLDRRRCWTRLRHVWRENTMSRYVASSGGGRAGGGRAASWRRGRRHAGAIGRDGHCGAAHLV